MTKRKPQSKQDWNRAQWTERRAPRPLAVDRRRAPALAGIATGCAITIMVGMALLVVIYLLSWLL